MYLVHDAEIAAAADLVRAGHAVRLERDAKSPVEYVIVLSVGPVGDAGQMARTEARASSLGVAGSGVLEAVLQGAARLCVACIPGRHKSLRNPASVD